MKISWGKGILIAIVIFIAGTFIMVGISMTKNVDLVANNYYEKEIKYQEQIDKLKKTGNLQENVNIDYNGSVVNVKFPSNLDVSKITGEVKFYRPSDEKKDFIVPVSANINGIIAIPAEKLNKGLWKIQVSWNFNNENYFTEQSLMIQ
ncbi:MAG: cytochrome C oxidase Cbb3 [Ignavibacteriae bacterium]|nr:MAG: cytochrome C oxidase Cbb3 [Ignavibacteriota bacterium]